MMFALKIIVDLLIIVLVIKVIIKSKRGDDERKNKNIKHD